MLFLFFALASSFAAQAEVDYRHCAEFVNDRSIGPNRRIIDGYWQMDAQGKLLPKMPKTASFSGTYQNGLYSFTDTLLTGAKLKGKVETSEGVPTKSVYETSVGGEVLGTETLTFSVKNDICVPESYEVKEKGVVDPEQSWNASLCRELAKYLAGHPEAIQCHCGNEQTDKAIEGMFRKFGLPPPTTELGGTGRSSFLKASTLSRQPLSRATGEIRQCDGIDGLDDALRNEKVWRNFSQGGASQEPGASRSNGSGT